MNITVNGIIKDSEPARRLQEFLSSLFASCDGIIVELNEEIVKRENWQETVLKDGDRIELIQMVGGG